MATIASVPEDALPWLIVTVRNVLSELHRRDERQTVLAQRLADTRRDQDTAPDHVEDAVVEKVVVLSALSTLSETDRETLMLISWDGLTARQAASVCPQTRSTSWPPFSPSTPPDPTVATSGSGRGSA